MELDWTKPNQFNTHEGSETFVATRDDKLYTILKMFGVAELTVVTSKNTVFKRTNLKTLDAAMKQAELV